MFREGLGCPASWPFFPHQRQLVPRRPTALNPSNTRSEVRATKKPCRSSREQRDRIESRVWAQHQSHSCDAWLCFLLPRTSHHRYARESELLQEWGTHPGRRIVIPHEEVQDAGGTEHEPISVGRALGGRK